MRVKIGDVNPKAKDQLPTVKPDVSGVGVNYAEAYLKPFKARLEDGTKILCKRRGLELRPEKRSPAWSPPGRPGPGGSCGSREDLYDGRLRKRIGWASVANVARRKLDMLDYAARLDDLRSPPGNRLELLIRFPAAGKPQTATTSRDRRRQRHAGPE